MMQIIAKLARLADIRGKDKCLESIRKQTLASLQAQECIEFVEANQRLNQCLAHVPDRMVAMLSLWTEAERDRLSSWLDSELERLETALAYIQVSVGFDGDPLVCRPRPGVVSPQVEPRGDCIHYHGRHENGVRLCCVPNPDGPGLFDVDCPYKETE